MMDWNDFWSLMGQLMVLFLFGLFVAVVVFAIREAVKKEK